MHNCLTGRIILFHLHIKNIEFFLCTAHIAHMESTLLLIMYIFVNMVLYWNIWKIFSSFITYSKLAIKINEYIVIVIKCSICMLQLFSYFPKTSSINYLFLSSLGYLVLSKHWRSAGSTLFCKRLGTGPLVLSQLTVSDYVAMMFLAFLGLFFLPLYLIWYSPFFLFSFYIFLLLSFPTGPS